jgi:hypothetical protein
VQLLQRCGTVLCALHRVAVSRCCASSMLHCCRWCAGRASSARLPSAAARGLAGGLRRTASCCEGGGGVGGVAGGLLSAGGRAQLAQLLLLHPSHGRLQGAYLAYQLRQLGADMRTTTARRVRWCHAAALCAVGAAPAHLAAVGAPMCHLAGSNSHMPCFLVSTACAWLAARLLQPGVGADCDGCCSVRAVFLAHSTCPREPQQYAWEPPSMSERDLHAAHTLKAVLEI